VNTEVFLPYFFTVLWLCRMKLNKQLKLVFLLIISKTIDRIYRNILESPKQRTWNKGHHRIWHISSFCLILTFFEHGNRAHGGCDRSTGDAYSSMALAPTSDMFRGPCTPILWFVFSIRLMRLITDLYFCHFIDGRMTTIFYDKHDDFNSTILNLCSDKPLSPAYCVYISHRFDTQEHALRMRAFQKKANY
jgi:hypothetical protein